MDVHRPGAPGGTVVPVARAGGRAVRRFIAVLGLNLASTDATMRVAGVR